MNELLATFSMCFVFLFFLEGLETAIKSKANKAYKFTHILYPLFVVGTLIYFLASGILEV